MVPVSISTASSPTTAVNRFVLKEKETTVTLENVKPDEWVKVGMRIRIFVAILQILNVSIVSWACFKFVRCKAHC